MYLLLSKNVKCQINIQIQKKNVKSQKSAIFDSAYRLSLKPSFVYEEAV